MKMKKETKAKKIIEKLKEIYPDAVCSLEYDGEPWKLLVLARLSAQCTDERVNIVSYDLFRVFPTIESMAQGELSEIEKIVKPCGLYHSKAKSIKEACMKILSDFDGKVPDNMEDLLSLSGVGRKIANLILGDVYGKGGIVADTHCIRISNRLGLCDSTVPVKVERTLDALVPKKEQSDLCHRLVQFGRDTCCARNPKCEECIFKREKICNFKP